MSETMEYPKEDQQLLSIMFCAVSNTRISKSIHIEVNWFTNDTTIVTYCVQCSGKENEYFSSLRYAIDYFNKL